MALIKILHSNEVSATKPEQVSHPFLMFQAVHPSPQSKAEKLSYFLISWYVGYLHMQDLPSFSPALKM
jgi:hypothetical protein